MIPILIEFKADVFTCDALGFTPLDHAVINGNYMGAIMLKRAGLQCKSFDFYKQKQDKFVNHHVNLEVFV